MNKKIFLTALLFGLIFSGIVSAATIDLNVENQHFEGTNIVFYSSVPAQTEMSYVSSATGRETVLTDNVYRQTHDMVLWNLEFTTYDYVLKVNDNKGVSFEKTGTFTVTPAEPTLIIKPVEKPKTLEQMDRTELLQYIVGLLTK